MSDLQKLLEPIKAKLAEATKVVTCPKCGNDDFRYPEYDYTFPYTGEDILYCENCGERTEESRPICPSDLSKLIEVVEVMDRALEKIEWMNQPPKSSTTRSLASEVRAKVKAILSGGKSEPKEG